MRDDPDASLQRPGVDDTPRQFAACVHRRQLDVDPRLIQVVGNDHSLRQNVAVEADRFAATGDEVAIGVAPCEHEIRTVGDAVHFPASRRRQDVGACDEISDAQPHYVNVVQAGPRAVVDDVAAQLRRSRALGEEREHRCDGEAEADPVDPAHETSVHRTNSGPEPQYNHTAMRWLAARTGRTATEL